MPREPQSRSVKTPYRRCAPPIRLQGSTPTETPTAARSKTSSNCSRIPLTTRCHGGGKQARDPARGGLRRMQNFAWGNCSRIPLTRCLPWSGQASETSCARRSPASQGCVGARSRHPLNSSTCALIRLLCHVADKHVDSGAVDGCRMHGSTSFPFVSVCLSMHIVINPRKNLAVEV
jgi:hypothetical protein